MKISKFTLCLSIYIIISSFFMQEVWITWRNIFGVKFLILGFILLCLWAISAILYKNIKAGLNLKRLVLILAICIWGFIFAWRQPYLAEKAHVLEFALLAWLTLRDLSKKNRGPLRDSFIALLFVAMIGFLEEGFQKFLPWRRCDIRDIITDILSGLLGIILFILVRPTSKNPHALS
jgi:glycopeptide antibiotics resistance protein